MEWDAPWWAKGEGGLSLAWLNDEMKTRTLPQDWVLYISSFSEV